MKIKINFCDMPRPFDVNNNYFTDVISKHFEGFEISDEPDFLFYSVFGIDHYKYSNCVKIFTTEEACVPDFNECDYAIGFDWIDFGDRYLKRPLWLEEIRYYDNYMQMTDEELLNRKFCNFVYFNMENGTGSKFRQDFVKRLSKYKQVDCPGRVLNNMKANLVSRYEGDWRKSKIEFVKDYKFTIAFENNSYPGYTTEKPLHAFVGRSVPIYWGNPLVGRVINQEAIINCNGYEDNLDEIIEKIIEIDKDDSKYLEMVHKEPMSSTFNRNELQDFEQFITDIIGRGNNPYNKDPRNFAKRMSVHSLSRRQKIEYFLLNRSSI